MKTFCIFFFFSIWFHFGYTRILKQYGSRSVNQCAHYMSIDYDGIVFPTIVGGVRAGEFELPHMAALGYVSPDNWLWECSGSLISNYYVLTAAHCLYPPRRFLKVVRLGTKNIFTPESTYMDYNISEKILHPHYRSNLRYNDIGLLRLSTRVIFTPKIKPACLHVTTDFNDNTLVASGWGKQGTFGDLSPHLLKVHLVLNSYDACNRTFGSQQRVLPQGIDPLSMICAAGRQNEIKDTCEGDSGGPLQISNDFYDFVVGITSFGFPCSLPNIASVYTRTSDYIGWIEDIVWQ